jgi:hypothetical protein
LTQSPSLAQPTSEESQWQGLPQKDTPLFLEASQQEESQALGQPGESQLKEVQIESMDPLDQTQGELLSSFWRRRGRFERVSAELTERFSLLRLPQVAFPVDGNGLSKGLSELMDQADTPQKIVVTAPTDDEAGLQVRLSVLLLLSADLNSLPTSTSDPPRRLPFSRTQRSPHSLLGRFSRHHSLPFSRSPRPYQAPSSRHRRRQAYHSGRFSFGPIHPQGHHQRRRSSYLLGLPADSHRPQGHSQSTFGFPTSPLYYRSIGRSLSFADEVTLSIGRHLLDAESENDEESDCSGRACYRTGGGQVDEEE